MASNRKFIFSRLSKEIIHVKIFLTMHTNKIFSTFFHFLFIQPKHSLQKVWTKPGKQLPAFVLSPVALFIISHCPKQVSNLPLFSKFKPSSFIFLSITCYSAGTYGNEKNILSQAEEPHTCTDALEIWCSYLPDIKWEPKQKVKRKMNRIIIVEKNNFS